MAERGLGGEGAGRGCGPPVSASLMTLEERPAGRRGPGWGGGARSNQGRCAPASEALRVPPGRLASAARSTGGSQRPQEKAGRSPLQVCGWAVVRRPHLPIDKKLSLVARGQATPQRTMNPPSLKLLPDLLPTRPKG